MKKLLIIFIAVCMCISTAACRNNEAENESTSAEEKEEMKKEPIFNIPDSPVDVYEAFREQSVTLSDGSEANFRIFIPDGYDAEAEYPLMLLLHGAGERGNDNSAQLINATQNLYNDLSSPVYGAVFIVPQCPAGKQWVNQSWTPGKYTIADTPESDEIKMVLEIIEWTEKNYSIDKNRRYAAGISMGGFGVWDLLLRHNDMFAGAVIMCGGGGDPSVAETVIDTPIYLVHSQDDAAVAYAGALETANAIKALGGEKLIFQTLNGYGHNVWNYTSQNLLVMPWLFSNIKEPSPDENFSKYNPTE